MDEYNPTYIETALERNIEDVNRLVRFDAVVLELAISQIRDLEEKLTTHHKLDNPHLTARNTLIILEGIHNNESLKPAFKTIYNQCIVLLVSVFAAAVAELFRSAIQYSVEIQRNVNLMKEELRFTVADILEEAFEPREKIGQLIADKKDLSFQDMKSIHRAFDDYFKVKMEKDDRVHDIIITQACRHIIVHDGGTINDRFLKQISSATPRKLKQDLPSSGIISFDPVEIKLAGEQMLDYFRELQKKLKNSLGSE